MNKKDNFVILLCILQQDTCRKNYFYSYCYHDLSISFSMVTPFLFFRRHTFALYCVFSVKFLCFFTLSTSFSHFTSRRPLHRLPSGDQVIISLGHLLSSMRITCPYHINMLLSSLSKIVLPAFFL